MADHDDRDHERRRAQAAEKQAAELQAKVAQLQREADALRSRLERAERNLKAAGFEDRGGKDWAPPIGPSPLRLVEKLDEVRRERDRAIDSFWEIDRDLRCLLGTRPDEFWTKDDIDKAARLMRRARELEKTTEARAIGERAVDLGVADEADARLRGEGGEHG
ncbi:MAG: hypothetical protein INH34_06115 [Phycisphaerales bacterium]|nr:hypothetical protein [Phycisphaerales bacterium]